MADSRTEPPVNDLADIDLTDGELCRHGFPHDVFTKLRLEAPEAFQAYLSRVEFTASSLQPFPWSSVVVCERSFCTSRAARPFPLFRLDAGPSPVAD